MCCMCVTQYLWTPLHRAAAGNNVNCINVLLDAGATVLLDDKDKVSQCNDTVILAMVPLDLNLTFTHEFCYYC